MVNTRTGAQTRRRVRGEVAGIGRYWLASIYGARCLKCADEVYTNWRTGEERTLGTLVDPGAQRDLDARDLPRSRRMTRVRRTHGRSIVQLRRPSGWSTVATCRHACRDPVRTGRDVDFLDVPHARRADAVALDLNTGTTTRVPLRAGMDPDNVVLYRISDELLIARFGFTSRVRVWRVADA